MNIGESIRKIRREREMTQQQLADALGISMSAVSQWEMGRTMPDIMTLPGLSSILGVSIDELLGVDQDQIAQLVHQRTQVAVQCLKQQDEEGMLRIAEQTYREYPSHTGAIGMYAWALQATGSLEHPERWEKSIRLSQKILDRSVNDGERVASISRICRCYAYLGDKENALRCARLLPDSATMTSHHVIQVYDLLPVEQRVAEYPRQISTLGSILTHYCEDVCTADTLSREEKDRVLLALEKLQSKLQGVRQALSEETK